MGLQHSSSSQQLNGEGEQEEKRNVRHKAASSSETNPLTHLTSPGLRPQCCNSSIQDNAARGCEVRREGVPVNIPGSGPVWEFSHLPLSNLNYDFL